MKEVFNDGVLRATLVEDNWLWIEWLTNKVGYLSKTVVKDLYRMERLIRISGWPGWAMASEKENTGMHKLIERFGGCYQKDVQNFKVFQKAVKHV